MVLTSVCDVKIGGWTKMYITLSLYLTFWVYQHKEHLLRMWLWLVAMLTAVETWVQNWIVLGHEDGFVQFTISSLFTFGSTQKYQLKDDCCKKMDGMFSLSWAILHTQERREIDVELKTEECCWLLTVGVVCDVSILKTIKALHFLSLSLCKINIFHIQ